MTLALYRKYRPRTFAEVIGQEHVTEPLSQALRSGRLHHAYLFSGPRGCGKTSSARILARSLNCERGPTPEPCGVCASCRSLANDGAGSIDVIEIDAASHGGVDDARDLREKAFFAPASSRYKIYVIDEAHMVSSAGFNALLKLVEEPPDYVKFIFATTEPEKVLGTIKSRTHHYPFRLIPPAVLRPYLEQLTEAEGIHVEPAVFPLVVKAGGGSARDTLSVLDQLIAGAGPEGVSYARAVSLLGVTDVALIDEMCDALAAGDGATAYRTIDRVAEAGHDPRRFASDLLERFRDLIVLQQVPDAVTKGLIDGPADQLEAMSAQATRLGPATLSRCADIVHNGLVEMRGTTAPRLLLELITARMLLPGADDSAGALLQRLERMERRLTLSGDDSAVRAEPAPTAADRTVVDRPVEAIAGDGAEGGGLSAARAAAAAAGRRTSGADSSASPLSQPAADASADSAPAADPIAAVDLDDDLPPEPEFDDDERPASGPPAVERRPEPAGVLPDAPAEPDEVATAAAPGQLSAAAIREVWPEIITAVGRQSKKVAALASGATVRELEGQTVVLTFRFPAHARMVAAEPELLSNALYEALGGRWQIRCDVAGEGAAEAAPARRPAPAQNGPDQRASGRRATAPAQSASPARQREAPSPARASAGAPAADDDDWPEPARPGGQTPASTGSPADPGREDEALRARPVTSTADSSEFSRAESGVGSAAAAASGRLVVDGDPATRNGGLGPASTAPVVGPGLGGALADQSGAAPSRPAGAPGSPSPSASGLPGWTESPGWAETPGGTESPSGTGSPGAIGSPGSGPPASHGAPGTGTPGAIGSPGSGSPGGTGSPGSGATGSPSGPTRAGSPMPHGTGKPVSGGLAAARAAVANAGRGGVGVAASSAAAARTAVPKAAAPRNAAATTAAARTNAARTNTARTDAASTDAARTAGPNGSHRWADGSAAEEPPYDPEYDGPAAGFEGFDPGDEPLDVVIDEKTARQSSEQQAVQLLQDAFGAEKIGEI